MHERVAMFLNRLAIEPVEAGEKASALGGVAIAKKKVDVTIHVGALRAGRVGGGNDELGEGDYGFVLMVVKEGWLPIGFGRLLRPGGRDGEGGAEFQKVAAMHWSLW